MIKLNNQGPKKKKPSSTMSSPQSVIRKLSLFPFRTLFHVSLLGNCQKTLDNKVLILKVKIFLKNTFFLFIELFWRLVAFGTSI